MAFLAGAVRRAAARVGRSRAAAGEPDEFQEEKWGNLHKSNAYFIRVDDGSDDICDMIRRRTAGEACIISEIGRAHMAEAGALRGKTVLEIGFGGGWYLAQALKEGASGVYGFEAADNIVRSASAAFDRLGLGPYQFYRVGGGYLDVLPRGSVDVAFSKTVFQHIHPRATAAYLRTVQGALRDGGYCLFQFLMNEKNPVRDSNIPDDEGQVSYTKAEVDSMVSGAGLQTLVYAETWMDDAGTGNYWAWYKLAKAPPAGRGPLPEGKSGAAAGDVVHMRGLIPPGTKSVLAVGCGVGSGGKDADALHEVCRGSRYEVTGIDASAERIRERKSNGPPGEYRAMDARDVHALGKKFDAIVCRHVLESLTEDDGRQMLGALEGMYSRLLVVSSHLAGSGGTTGGGGGDGRPRAWGIRDLRARQYYVRQTVDHLIAFKTSEHVPGGAPSTELELERLRSRPRGGRRGPGGGPE